MAGSGDEPASATGGLLVSAWRARWREPEVAVALARHAEALADDPESRIPARAVVASARFRLGGERSALPEAVSALRAVEAAGSAYYGPVTAYELARALRIDLAGRATSVGLPRSAFAALTPVLAASETAPAAPAMRAAGLVRLVRCLSGYGRQQELERALSAADRLYASETTLPAETVTALRALSYAVTAGLYRRRADASAAVAAAADGLRLLDGTGTLAAGGRHARSRLTLELVSALLDRGERDAAERFAQQALTVPPRAQELVTSAWLRFVLAVRLHWQRGELTRAQDMLREVSATARRHRVYGLRVEAEACLAQLCELTGDLAGAMECTRSTQVAERARTGSRDRTRSLLATEFPPSTTTAEEMFAQLGQWLSESESVPGERAGDAHPDEPTSPPPPGAATDDAGGEGAVRRSSATPAAAEPVPPRHGPGSSRPLSVKQVPGVVVAEGSGGRRRAPDPEAEQEVEQGEAAPSPESSGYTPAGAEADPAAGAEHGRHGAPGMASRAAAGRARSGGRATALRSARHAVPEDTSVTEGVGPEQRPKPEPSKLASTVPEPSRSDLGLGDLLTEALAAFRDGEQEGAGRHAEPEATDGTDEAFPSEPAGAHAPGQRSGSQWHFTSGDVPGQRHRSSG